MTGSPTRLRLDNGLRVVLDEHGDAGATGVTVVYGGGAHADPDGQEGLAHLVEHLMFQGSAGYGAFAHFNYVQGLGGVVNARTWLDHTEFYQEVPATGLEALLAMEADRMAGFIADESRFRREIEVVKQEIRSGLAHPMAAFPWRWLAPLVRGGRSGAGDPAGSLNALDRLTLAQARAFFDAYYAPGDAVLAVSGHFATPKLTALIEELFGGIHARPSPGRVPAAVNHHDRTHHVFAAPTASAACAVAWPLAEGPASTQAVVYELLAKVLDTAVRDRARTAGPDLIRAWAALGVHDLGLNCAAPSAIAAAFHLGDRAQARQAVELAQRELQALAEGALTGSALEACVRRERISVGYGLDSFLHRSRELASYEFFLGAPAGALRKDADLRAVRPQQLASAARALLRHAPISIELAPHRESS
ncbi:M16 family metallopeptidase [Nonomuraea sp. LPB2021202275-12-8]|uniref:M16 family metallopeptidase n=1 Tax=Nonomuraea sp. LPB2021202275-12-8 TaxID=3120159 RepID=UPI00300D22A7